MNRETVYKMRGFVNEIEKEAAIIPWLGRAVERIPYAGPRAVRYVSKALRNKFGRQVLTGAALGGGTGYLTADDEHKLRNMLIGAGAGAGLAGARIATTPALRQEFAQQVKGGTKKYRYHLTGKGLGATPAAELEEAHRLGILHKPVTSELPLDAVKRQKVLDAYKREVEAFGRGEYSAPGVFHSLLSSPGQFFKQQWQRNPLLMKGFTAYGAYGTGKSLLEKPEEGGPGRFEKALGSAGLATGWLASPHGFFPGLVVAPVLGKAGKKIGKGVDTLLGTHAQPAPQPNPLAENVEQLPGGM